MAKMKDWVLKKRLGTSRLNKVFPKLYSQDPTLKFQVLGIGLNATFMKTQTKNLLGIFFRMLRKWGIKKIKLNLNYRFFKNFGYKCDSSLQTNCENFIISCIVGFWAIPNACPLLSTHTLAVVRHLQQQHNAMTWPGLKTRPLDPESSILAIRHCTSTI